MRAAGCLGNGTKEEGAAYLVERERLCAASDRVIQAVDGEGRDPEVRRDFARADLPVVLPSVLEAVQRCGDDLVKLS